MDFMDFIDTFTESEKKMLLYSWCFLSAFMIPCIILVVLSVFIIPLSFFNYDFLLIFATNHKFVVSGILFVLSISGIAVINIRGWEKTKTLTLLLLFIIVVTFGAGLGSFVFSFLLQGCLIESR